MARATFDDNLRAGLGQIETVISALRGAYGLEAAQVGMRRADALIRTARHSQGLYQTCVPGQ